MNKLVPYYSNYCELSPFACCCSAADHFGTEETFKQSCHKKSLITEKFQFFSFNGSSSFGEKRHRNFYTVISSPKNTCNFGIWIFTLQFLKKGRIIKLSKIYLENIRPKLIENSEKNLLFEKDKKAGPEAFWQKMTIFFFSIYVCQILFPNGWR